MQKISITGIESKATKTGNTKIILICQEGKFYFYRNTKNGPSKAAQQFDKYSFKLGDVVDVEVQSEEKSFTNDKGKEITYQDNWIKFFGEIDHQPVVSPVAPQNAPKNDTQERLDKAALVVASLLQRVEKLEKQVEAHGTLLVDVRGKEAVDLHTSLGKSQDIPEITN